MTRVPFPREAYYERIGATDTLLPLVDANTSSAPGALGVSFLRNLMLAHLSTIPFENIDVILGRPISTHLANIYDKLIHAGRGGYCFEQNTLLRAAMVDAGFTHIRTLGARAAISSEESPVSRTHILCLVTIHQPEETAEGEEKRTERQERWLVDIGTSAGVPMAPLRLDVTASQFTPAGEFRVRHYDLCTNHEMVRFARPTGGHDAGWTEYVIEMHAHSGIWRALHRFDLQPLYPRDVFAINHITQTLSPLGFSLRGSRVIAAWAPAGTQGIPNGVGGFVCVPRGLYNTYAEDTVRVSTRTAIAYPGPEAAAPPAGELAPLEPQEAHPTTPGELYDWMQEHLQLDFEQTRLPPYNVSKDEFESALRRQLVVFGGATWVPPEY